MIGTNLNLTLPLLSDTLATIVAKTAAALSQIEVSIADDVTPTAINIAQSLSMNGNWLTNTGGIILADGNNPTSPGSVYYHNNEIYVIDSTRAVQLTLNGAINVAGVGGIGGDYGGSIPHSSRTTRRPAIRFYTNGGTLAWADLSAGSLLLNNSTYDTKIKASASQSGTYTLTLRWRFPAVARSSSR